MAGLEVVDVEVSVVEHYAEIVVFLIVVSVIVEIDEIVVLVQLDHIVDICVLVSHGIDDNA